MKEDQIDDLKTELRCTKRWYRNLHKCYENQVKSKEKLLEKLKMKENEILSLKADLEMANDRIKFLENESEE